MGQKLSRNELLGELRHLTEDLGRPPKQDEMDAHGEYSKYPYHREFGSWNNALEAIGCDLNQITGRDPEVMISDLKDLADELGRAPIREEAQEHCTYSPNSYRREFGCWSDAVIAAGLTPVRVRDIGPSELVDEIQRVAEKLGKAPSRVEFDEHSKYSSLTCCRTFDSWDDAVMNAGYEPWEHPTGDDHPLWAGGVWDQEYGSSWSDQREKAIQRDGEECSLSKCGMTRERCREAFEKDLHVHHIQSKRIFVRDDGSFDHEQANALSNLITLCPPHHATYEGVPIDIRHKVASNPGE